MIGLDPPNSSPSIPPALRSNLTQKTNPEECPHPPRPSSESPSPTKNRHFSVSLNLNLLSSFGGLSRSDSAVPTVSAKKKKGEPPARKKTAAEKEEIRPFVHPIFFQINKMHIIFERAYNLLNLFRSKISYTDQKIPTSLYLQKLMGDLSRPPSSHGNFSPRPFLLKSSPRMRSPRMSSPRAIASSVKRKDEGPIPWITKFLDGAFGAETLGEDEKQKWSRVFHALCGRKEELIVSKEENEEEIVAKLSSYFAIAILVGGIGGECNRSPLGRFAKNVDDHFKTVITPIVNNNSLESSERGYSLLTYRELRLVSLETWHNLHNSVELGRGNLTSLYPLFGHALYEPTSSKIRTPEEISKELKAIWSVIAKITINRRKNYFHELQLKMENLAERKIEKLKTSPAKKDVGIRAEDRHEMIRTQYSPEILRDRLEKYHLIFREFYQSLVNFEAFLKRYEKGLQEHILETKRKIEESGGTSVDFSHIEDYGAFGSPRYSEHKISITMLEADRSRSTSRYLEIEPLLKNIILLKKIANRILDLSEKSSAY